MKEGWQIKKLGEVCQVVGGGTPPKNRPDFYTGNIPWATVRDMRQDVIAETEYRISEQAVRESATNIIPANNVVIATRVGLGKVCLVACDTAINQDLRGIIPLSLKTLGVRFLFWWLKSVAHLIEQEGTGATVQGVKLPFIKGLPLPLPPLPEQQRIVALLDDAFDGIARAKANAEQNLKNARELFESHLQAVFTQRGEGWVEKRLDEVGTTQTGSTPKTSEPKNYGTYIPFIKPANFNADGSLEYEQDGLSELGCPKARTVKAGSVLMVCIGATIGKAGFSDRDVTTNQQINALTPRNNVSHKFLYYQMITADFQRRVLGSSAQATLPIINKSKWSSLTVAIPPESQEQLEIVRKLDALLATTQSLESIYQQKQAALDELKKSLLHKAFSGEL